MSENQIVKSHREGGKYVEVDGLNVFYRHAGQRNGIPLIMTHGIPRSSFLYRKMIPILAKKHEIYAWDLFGFGLSDKPDENRYSFPKFETFLGKFIDKLGVEKAHIICHDVGGPFTIGWAVKNPNRVATLTILNTTIFFKHFRIPPPVLATILTPMFFLRRRTQEQAYGFLLDYVRKKVHHNPNAMTPEEEEAYMWLHTRKKGFVTLARTLKSYRTVAPYLVDTRKRLAKFDKPVNVIWGKHDPFCTLPTAQAFKDTAPDSEMKIIEEAGHFLQEDAPEKTSEYILDFIERRGGAGKSA